MATLLNICFLTVADITKTAYKILNAEDIGEKKPKEVNRMRGEQKL